MFPIQLSTFTLIFKLDHLQYGLTSRLHKWRVQRYVSQPRNDQITLGNLTFGIKPTGRFGKEDDCKEGDEGKKRLKRNWKTPSNTARESLNAAIVDPVREREAQFNNGVLHRE